MQKEEEEREMHPLNYVFGSRGKLIFWLNFIIVIIITDR
jgi:hypothetical protein